MENRHQTSCQEVRKEELNVDNWLKVMELTVSEEQKEIFPISNVYWVGISRYEEGTTLYAIKNDELFYLLLKKDMNILEFLRGNNIQAGNMFDNT